MLRASAASWRTSFTEDEEEEDDDDLGWFEVLFSDAHARNKSTRGRRRTEFYCLIVGIWKFYWLRTEKYVHF